MKAAKKISREGKQGSSRKRAPVRKISNTLHLPENQVPKTKVLFPGKHKQSYHIQLEISDMGTTVPHVRDGFVAENVSYVWCRCAMLLMFSCMI